MITSDMLGDFVRHFISPWNSYNKFCCDVLLEFVEGEMQYREKKHVS